MAAFHRIDNRVVRRDDAALGEHAGSRVVAEETPVAFTYNRATYAVMMATPADLADFAAGFTLTEAIAGQGGIEELEVLSHPDGIELRMWLDADRLAAVEARRRRIAGPTGCGLCGIDSLAEAVRPPARIVGNVTLDAAALLVAFDAMAPMQTLNSATRAAHAAAFWHPSRAAPVLLREDVGRHNALDKLAGALARAGIDAAAGAVLMTSRVSVELVQKTAAIGAPVLACVSAPTALAIRVAEAAGITLIGVARTDGFEVFTHPGRIAVGAAVDATG